MRQLALPKLDALPLGAHHIFVLSDEVLFRETGVRFAFAGRAGGVSTGMYASLNTADHVGDDGEAVRRNRAIALEALGVPADLLVVPNQVHGTEVLNVEDGYAARSVLDRAAAGADAIAIEAPRVAALMNFADCLSLIVVSPTGRFAMAHAGWRGAVAGIAGKAVCALATLDQREGALANPGAYNAYIGPHIRRECFEVGDDVTARFANTFGDAVVQGTHVDLAAAVTCDLQRAGLAVERIADARICTKCHPDQYFSYRAANGRCGRHAAIACRA